MSIMLNCVVPYMPNVYDHGILPSINMHAHFIPIVGVRKEMRTLIGPLVTCKMAAPVTGTTLWTTGPVPADSRQ